METKWLSIRETAILCKVYPTTIRQHIKRGLLPATKVGKSYIIKEDDLVHFRKRNRWDKES
ncbi:hypothetical protein CCZ01_07850 [Helicobacter monodelphidis]|uniref:helix-turn-helix domain-containing protein n=1 Tax=Helicobacter sp. 15-1451 TaxID=2004995 RepID=UPI000DCBC0DB|nr:helix-turn-helix domain-containing protein [Helicobacter sp. 15-1451]RAX56957.1 hypothetical protein CCZ01_07850 [Helicobacter sp. 15-1451]